MSKLFLFFTHSSSLMGLGRGQGWGTAGKEEVMRGPMNVPAGNAASHTACHLQGLHRPGETRRTAGTRGGLCTRVPRGTMHREWTQIYIYFFKKKLFIYLTAVGLPPPSLSVLEWVTALCFTVEKMSGHQERGVRLHHSTRALPTSSTANVLCTPLREDHSNSLFNEIAEKTKLKIRHEEHQEMPVGKIFIKAFHRQNLRLLLSQLAMAMDSTTLTPLKTQFQGSPPSHSDGTE